ncbi:MAG: hypothetical protein ACOVKN_02755 [Arenimonas sp.]
MANNQVIDCAQNFFAAATGDAARIAAIKAASIDAAMSGTTKGGLDSLQNAMKNSVSMGKLIALNEIDRGTALRLATQWLTIGFMPCQSRSYGRF